MKYYYDPQNRLPYKKRLRNRIIAITLFILVCASIGSCIYISGDSKDKSLIVNGVKQTSAAVADSAQASAAQDFSAGSGTADSASAPESALKPLTGDAIATTEAAPEASNSADIDTAAKTIPDNDPVDSVHIKAQKDVFLAEKIDNMLRRFRPMHSAILVVEPKSNEIIAWGETKGYKVQNSPDYFVKETFPAASLAKTITIAAAMESNRYSLNSPIPDRGAHHTLYKNQLRVPENYKGATIELQDAYAKSANPPLAIIGMNTGAKRLREAARNLGYNMNFPGGIPARSAYLRPEIAHRARRGQVQREHLLRAARRDGTLCHERHRKEAHFAPQHGPQELQRAHHRRKDRLSRRAGPARAIRMVHGIRAVEGRPLEIDHRRHHAGARPAGIPLAARMPGGGHDNELLGAPDALAEKIMAQ